jgi:hypothetical protein
MEHRYGKRFPADLKTLIFKNGMPVAIGRVCNFSCEGVFVKTEFDLIDINQPLEIELTARGSKSSIDYGERKLCKTFVMHKANDGIGLLLREDCVETQTNFAAFVAEELSRTSTIEGPSAVMSFVPTMPLPSMNGNVL